MTRVRESSTTWGDLTITGRFSPGTRPYFDRSWGNWLPGDPAEVEDLCIRDASGADITGQMTDDDLARFSDLLADRAADDDADAYADALEREWDMEREERLMGDKR